MTRKSTLAFIAVISVLMFYTGCDGDDGNGGGMMDGVPPGAEPPPGGGVPPPIISEECGNCPCSFFDVPMSEDCWVSEDTPPGFDPGSGVPGERCSLFPANSGFGNGLVVFLGIAFACPQGQACCLIRSFPDSCPVDNVAVELTFDNFQQVRDCQACLEQYATELNEVLMVEPDPPYECITR